MFCPPPGASRLPELPSQHDEKPARRAIVLLVVASGLRAWAIFGSVAFLPDHTHHAGASIS